MSAPPLPLTSCRCLTRTRLLGPSSGPSSSLVRFWGTTLGLPMWHLAWACPGKPARGQSSARGRSVKEQRDSQGTLTLPHQQGIPFLSQRSHTTPVTSPRASSEAGARPFPLSWEEPSALNSIPSSSSGLPAESNNGKNSHRHGALSREGPPSSWRSRSSSYLRASSSARTRASLA